MLNTALVRPDYQKELGEVLAAQGKFDQHRQRLTLSVSTFFNISDDGHGYWYGRGKAWVLLDYLVSKTIGGGAGWVTFKDLRSRSLSTYLVSELAEYTPGPVTLIEKRDGKDGKEYRVTDIGVVTLCFGVDRWQQKAALTEAALVTKASQETADVASTVAAAFEDVCIAFDIDPTPESLRQWLSSRS